MVWGEIVNHIRIMSVDHNAVEWARCLHCSVTTGLSGKGSAQGAQAIVAFANMHKDCKAPGITFDAWMDR